MLHQTKLAQAFSTLRLFLRAILLTGQAHRALALLTLALVLFSAFMAPLQVWITKLVIDGVTTAAGQGAAPANDPAAGRSLLLPLALYLGIWALGRITEALDGQLHELMGVLA